MIAFACSGCARRYEVADDKAGKSTRCPKCKTVLIVPKGWWEEPVAVVEPGFSTVSFECFGCRSLVTARDRASYTCEKCGRYYPFPPGGNAPTKEDEERAELEALSRLESEVPVQEPEPEPEPRIIRYFCFLCQSELQGSPGAYILCDTCQMTSITPAEDAPPPKPRATWPTPTREPGYFGQLALGDIAAAVMWVGATLIIGLGIVGFIVGLSSPSPTRPLSDDARIHRMEREKQDLRDTIDWMTKKAEADNWDKMQGRDGKH
jgi:ribosomal protein S27E